MTQNTLLLTSIGLFIAGITSFYIAWTSLTFQKNAKQEYDFHELAFYGGRFSAFKNFFRGLASLCTRKHQALLKPSLLVLLSLSLIAGALYLFTLSRN